MEWGCCDMKMYVGWETASIKYEGNIHHTCLASYSFHFLILPIFNHVQNYTLQNAQARLDNNVIHISSVDMSFSMDNIVKEQT